MMNDRFDGIRTFDLTTGSGRTTAFVMTTAPVALVLLAWAMFPGDVAVVVGASVGVYFIGVVIPAWLNWLIQMSNHNLRQQALIDAMSNPSVAAAQAQTALEAAKVRTLEAIRQLSPGGIEYATLTHGTHKVLIDGARVLWMVGGSQIPVTFAEDWWTEYVRRGEGDELPGQADFANYPSRDIMRQWCKLVTAELIKTGKVQQAESRYPPRWIAGDKELRLAALREAGLFAALIYCEALKEIESEE